MWKIACSWLWHRIPSTAWPPASPFVDASSLERRGATRKLEPSSAPRAAPFGLLSRKAFLSEAVLLGLPAAHGRRDCCST